MASESRISPRTVACATLVALASTGCAARYEAAMHHDLRVAREELADLDETNAPAPDGTLASYVVYAMAESPQLLASYQRWRASTLRISSARRLPEPVVVYGYYALPVQTRVGPQRHRVSAEQSFPWPTRLSAAADAQSARARAAQRRFEAQAFALRREVAEAWWSLSYVRQMRGIEREQLEVLGGLSESLRARVESNQATLADLAQLDLTRARLDDHQRELQEAELSAAAALRAAIGAPPDLDVPTADVLDDVSLPAEPRERLEEGVRAHPFLESFDLLAEANEAQAAAYEAERFPRFTLGVDYIETGPAATSGVPGSGDDALAVRVGLSIPLWQEAYDDQQRSAEAEAAADRADRAHAESLALAELDQALSVVRDSHRRVHHYRDTLLPLAETTFESVTGAFITGRASVASALLAQRDLLELALGLLRARVDHGRGWARLERVVGRPVTATEALGDPESTP